MKRKLFVLTCAVLTALFLSGCARTIDELYSPPRRSESYSRLQSAIDIAMAGLDYSAPLTGENQQAVQMADLDGDGVEEYLVFAKGNSDKPMQILVFSQGENGNVEIEEIITSNGTAFELVLYEDIDGKPGLELIVGRQVSEQLMGSVCVYSFSSGRAERLMNAGYSSLLTQDLGGSEQKELVLVQRGDTDQSNAIAVLYRYRSKSMARSLEVELSRPASSVRRVSGGKLQCGTPAVYISSTTEDSAIRTDILALVDDRLVKIQAVNPTDSFVQTLSNYYVYADDVDEDSVMEIPRLIPVKSQAAAWDVDEQYVIGWYSVDRNGIQTDKLYSFHNFSDGWYLRLEEEWISQITVSQVGSNYVFSLWDEHFETMMPLFTVYALTGSDRENQATQDGRFLLSAGADVIYAARLEEDCAKLDIDEEYLIQNFHLIHQEWKS
ncbi:MAG: hypothetical protein IKY96_05230 [Oscillospiraceae bacterium]|nr:hypothetical protein [Oscillospiraceae bacterium]